MQPAARHGQFRWTGGESGSRTFDVRVTRVDHDEFLIALAILRDLAGGQ
jgi:hypothetical protein